ncbi:MAG: hypothetical protein J7K09_08700, partial [Desulfuromusa sp.]|nr:hypothetical protein [Desulfuromusa sp.]
KTVSIICSISALVFITGYLSVPLAWSAPGDKKPAIQKPADKDVKELGDLKDGKKGKKSVKKKVVTKAGTAAAIGVAGAKVKSGAKGKVSKNKE